MLDTTIVTKEDLETRLALRVRGRNKVSVTQRALSNRVNEVIMGKHQVEIEYLRHLQALKDRIGEDQQVELLKLDEENEKSTVVAIETGMRYDKVLIGWMNKDRSFTPMEVRYFVERSTGDIYGAKSSVAPNLRWYFGNIYDANQWDWSGHHAVPKGTPEALTMAEKADPEKVKEYQEAVEKAAEKAGVRLARAYGSYLHFEKIDADGEKNDPPAKTMKEKPVKPKMRKRASKKEAVSAA